MKIEVFSKKIPLLRPRWYFRVRAGNGEIVLQSEGYSRRIDAIGTVHALRSAIPQAEIIDA